MRVRCQLMAAAVALLALVSLVTPLRLCAEVSSAALGGCCLASGSEAGDLVLVAPTNGATVRTHTPLQDSYLLLPAATRRSDAWFGSDVQRTKLAGTRPLATHPQKTLLAWRGGSAPYTVRVSKGGSHDAEVAVFANVMSMSCAIDNLEIGCAYRWSVECAAGRTEGSFCTSPDAPRLLRAGSRVAIDKVCHADVSNVRDMGGYIGLHGHRVRQGLLIRCAQLDRRNDASEMESLLSDESRAFFNDFLKVKTDIDLRGESKVEPLGPGVRLLSAEVHAYGYYSSADRPDYSMTSFKRILKTLTKRESYPVIFHCAAGQDRTGCVAYILGALLGIGEEHLAKDWEASVFHNAKGAFGFNAKGLDPAKGDSCNLDLFVRNLRTFGRQTMRENAEAWARRCGCTDADIERFRTIMLEDYDSGNSPQIGMVPGSVSGADAGGCGIGREV